MGYDLHITRRENWSDETPDISFDEWLAYANNDPELELTNGYKSRIGQETYDRDSPGFCEWHAHPEYKEPGKRPWFSYYQGTIDTKNPDGPTIRKMMQIASVLDAKVQGDDGEIYTEEYLAELERQEEKRMQRRNTVKKPWWQFW